jgi:hypothetical protein
LEFCPLALLTQYQWLQTMLAISPDLQVTINLCVLWLSSRRYPSLTLVE